MQAELSRYFCSLYRLGQGPFIGRAAILAASSKANAEITEGARRARDSLRIVITQYRQCAKGREATPPFILRSACPIGRLKLGALVAVVLWMRLLATKAA